MAKQGNSDTGRKGTRKSSGTTSRSRKRQDAPIPQPPTAAPESSASTPAEVSGGRSRRTGKAGKPAGERKGRRAPTTALVSEPAAVSESVPVPEEPILPVEVIDAAASPEEPEAAGRAKASGRRNRERVSTRSNALGVLIERRFADATSPVRSYSELERRSHISREALSRYVTPRADRRRSPTIETLAAIADAMHLSLEQVCRAAVAGAHGLPLPDQTLAQARDEIIGPLVATLSEEQFFAVIELLRQMQTRSAPA